MSRHERILVVGGSGFLGRYLVRRLCAEARYVVVPTRAPEHAKHLSVLPNCQIIAADVHDDESLRRLVQGCDAVVNLVGILHDGRGDPYGAGFARAHVELPQRLARVCVQMDVPRLLHVSALGVSDTGRLPSMYLRSKADGERAIRDTAGLDWTIFRPSVVFGREDRFLNLFADMSRWLPLMVVGRADARFAPVHVYDVAQAIVAAMWNRKSFGRTYELGGPEIYTLRELVKLAGRMIGAERPVIGLPDGLGRLQAAVLEFMPGPTLMSRDNFDSMAVPNVPRDAAHPFPPELGIKPAALSVLAPTWLRGHTLRPA